MSKITLSDVTTLTNETSFLSTTNTNYATIETASDLFLSRDGTSPNSMVADLDMNSNRILNLPVPSNGTEPLRLQDLSDFIGNGTIVTGTPDLNSVKDTYSAVGDGIVNDTTAITSANSNAGAKFVPTGTYVTTLSSTALDGPYWGFGQIRTGATNKRAPYYSAIKSNIAYTVSNEDSAETAFTGDFSRSLFPVEHRITGAATLTQPTSGYVYSPWATPHYTYLYNESGWNNSTSDNSGRTAATAHRVKLFHVGQGDAVAFNVSAFVNSTRSGSTSFLANPAVVLFNGDMLAGQAGVFLNAGELSLSDGGFDVAGIGWVVNLNRSVSTGAKDAFWNGFRVQSIGSADVNAAFSASGKYDVGLDFSTLTTDTNKAALALLPNDRIYFNASSSNGYYATALGAVYTHYNSSSSALDFVLTNNSPSLRLKADASAVNFIQIVGRATGIAATLEAEGADTDIQILWATKGGSPHLFRTGGVSGPTQFQITATASATRNISVTGSNGGNPTLSVTAGNLAITPAIVAASSIKSTSATAGIGYDTGAGGTVTQGTSRTTGVTLNTICGEIVLFSQVNTAVSGATAQTFTVTNSNVAATDTILVHQKTGTDAYLVFVTNVAAGSFKITNYTTGGTTNEAPKFAFSIQKAVIS